MFEFAWDYHHLHGVCVQTHYESNEKGVPESTSTKMVKSYDLSENICRGETLFSSANFMCIVYTTYQYIYTSTYYCFGNRASTGVDRQSIATMSHFMYKFVKRNQKKKKTHTKLLIIQWSFWYLMRTTWTSSNIERWTGQRQRCLWQWKYNLIGCLDCVLDLE